MSFTKVDYKDQETIISAKNMNDIQDAILTLEDGLFTMEGNRSGEIITITDASNRGFRSLNIFGKTTQDGTPTPDAPVDLVSVGDDGSLSVLVAGKNLWDHSNDTGNMSSLSNWGYPIWANSAVRKTFKPKTTYTMKCKVTCLSIPPYATVYSDQIGFVLHASNNDGNNALMAVDIGNGPLAVGEQRTLRGTFTTQEDVSSIARGYRILYYTQRFLQEDGKAVYASIRVDNVQLEIGGTASDYVPYTGQEMRISTPNGLPGIPVTSGGNYTDANGQQWICDEIDFARGVYVQRCGECVIDGSSYISVGKHSNGQSYCTIETPGIIALDGNAPAMVLCDRYTASSWTNTNNKAYCIGRDLVLTDNRFSDKNTALSILGMEKPKCIYVLASPIETPLSEEELAAYAALHTYKDNTTVSNDASAYMELEYVMDAKKYIDGLFAGTIIPATVE